MGKQIRSLERTELANTLGRNLAQEGSVDRFCRADWPVTCGPDASGTTSEIGPAAIARLGATRPAIERTTDAAGRSFDINWIGRSTHEIQFIVRRAQS